LGLLSGSIDPSVRYKVPFFGILKARFLILKIL